MYSKLLGNIIKGSKILIVIGFCFYVALTSKVEKVNSLENKQKNDFYEKTIDYSVEEIEDPNLPYMQRTITQKGINGLLLSYNDININIQNPTNEVVLVGSKILSTFYGDLTGYGPDCIGCSGRTACAPSQNLRDGNIYFNDATFGKLNILAADSIYPCGSIIKITTNKLSSPILGIVLDRGGAVTGNTIDLLADTEVNALHRTNNVKYELVRKGW